MNQSININSIALAIILIATLITFYAVRKKSQIIRLSEEFTIPDIVPVMGIEIPVKGKNKSIR